MGKRGPKLALTPAFIDAFVPLIEAGNYLQAAAPAAGFAHQTVRSWITMGRDLLAQNRAAELEGKSLKRTEEQRLLVQLVTRYQVASAKAEIEPVAELRAAGKGKTEGNFNASVAFLERRFPKRWGLRIKVLVDEELDAFLQRLEQNLDGPTYERVLRASHGEISRRPSPGDGEEEA